MRPVNLLIALIVVAIFGTILVLLSDGLIIQSNGTQIVSPADVMADPVEPLVVDVREPIHEIGESVEYQVTSQEDGRSLLESLCAQCHIPQLLMQVKKERIEWEKTLAQMEAVGVHLSDDEREILLDYLTAADNP